MFLKSFISNFQQQRKERTSRRIVQVHVWKPEEEQEEEEERENSTIDHRKVHEFSLHVKIRFLALKLVQFTTRPERTLPLSGFHR